MERVERGRGGRPPPSRTFHMPSVVYFQFIYLFIYFLHFVFGMDVLHKLITVRTDRQAEEHATSNHYPLGSALSSEQLKGNRMASSSCCLLINLALFCFLFDK